MRPKLSKGNDASRLAALILACHLLLGLFLRGEEFSNDAAYNGCYGEIFDLRHPLQLAEHPRIEGNLKFVGLVCHALNIL